MSPVSDDQEPGPSPLSSSTPVELSGSPRVIEGRRVLAVIPGKPNAGERKDPGGDDIVMVWPHLLVPHAVMALGAMLTVLVISVFFDAPLQSVANPTLTPNPEKAPWYFAGLQELLSHFHPLVAGILIPGAIVVGLIALPYFDRSRFIRPKHRKVAVVTFTIFLVIWIGLTLAGFAFLGLNWLWAWPWNE